MPRRVSLHGDLGRIPKVADVCVQMLEDLDGALHLGHII